MIVQELIEKSGFSVLNAGNISYSITNPFCCDLLSIAMSKASPNTAWITVMGNVNTIAVAVLADVSCIILAENIELDSVALEKAVSQNVTILKSPLPIFETALKVYNLINNYD